MNDRRVADRERTSKAASIVFGKQTGEHACEVEVTDLGNGGAGIYRSGQAILPLKFELLFDGLRRNCRMVWRKGNFFGVTFEDHSSPTQDTSHRSPVDLVFEGSEFSALGDPPQLAYPHSDQLLSEFTSIIAERSSANRSDVHFLIGVVLALALPVLLGLGAYVATTVALAVG
jgi:hypothetical protein